MTRLLLAMSTTVAYISGQVRPAHFPESSYKTSECDIYVAEVEAGEYPG